MWVIADSEGINRFVEEGLFDMIYFFVFHLDIIKGHLGWIGTTTVVP